MITLTLLGLLGVARWCGAAPLPQLKLCFDDGTCVTRLDSIHSTAAQRVAVNDTCIVGMQYIGGCSNANPNSTIYVTDTAVGAVPQYWDWVSISSSVAIDYGAPLCLCNALLFSNQNILLFLLFCHFRSCCVYLFCGRIHELCCSNE